MARKKAREKFHRESNLPAAKEMISQILSMKESHANYYGTVGEDSIDELKRQFDIIYESLTKPIIRMESAGYVWLLKK